MLTHVTFIGVSLQFVTFRGHDVRGTGTLPEIMPHDARGQYDKLGIAGVPISHWSAIHFQQAIIYRAVRYIVPLLIATVSVAQGGFERGSVHVTIASQLRRTEDAVGQANGLPDASCGIELGETLDGRKRFAWPGQPTTQHRIIHIERGTRAATMSDHRK